MVALQSKNSYPYRLDFLQDVFYLTYVKNQIPWLCNVLYLPIQVFSIYSIVWNDGATSEYPDSHALLTCKSIAPVVRGPQSASKSMCILLSVKMKCYHGPQSHSRWISNKRNSELKCYCALPSCSWWINIKLSSSTCWTKLPQWNAVKVIPLK